MCEVGRMDAYVIGPSRRMRAMCVHVCEREERWKGQGHINKDLANITIMFGHSPELLLAGGQTPKQAEIEGKLSGSVTLSFQAKKEHLISHLWQADEPFGVCVGGGSVRDLL